MRELLEKRHCDLFISAKTVNMFILYANSVCSTLLKSILILPLKMGGKSPQKICTHPLVIFVIGTKGDPLATSNLPSLL